MRGLEAALFFVVLIAVPAAAWFFGRFAGRNDWSVARVVAGAAAVAVLMETLAVAVRALTAARPSRPANALESLMPIEAAAFLAVLAVFMAVIGWSSVPAKGKERQDAKS
jgi:hypothetical protein